MVMRDLNAKIEKTEDGVQHLSPNGKLLLDIIKKHELDVCNFNTRCTGKWTHVVRTSGNKSVLDYLITSHEVTRLLVEMRIDEDCVFCPFWVRKKKGTPEPQYSDHNSIVAKFTIPHQKREIPKKSS